MNRHRKHNRFDATFAYGLFMPIERVVDTAGIYEFIYELKPSVFDAHKWLYLVDSSECDCWTGHIEQSLPGMDYLRDDEAYLFYDTGKKTYTDFQAGYNASDEIRQECMNAMIAYRDYYNQKQQARQAAEQHDAANKLSKSISPLSAAEAIGNLSDMLSKDKQSETASNQIARASRINLSDKQIEELMAISPAGILCYTGIEDLQEFYPDYY